MGLFGGPIGEVDPAFAACIVSSDDHGRKVALKVLAKNDAGLKTMLVAGESPLCTGYYMDGVRDSVFMVTTNRTVTVRKNAVQKELHHSDVAETKIGTLPNSKMLVIIESHASRLDYAPNDIMRHEKIIQLQVGTPRVAQTICAAIDQYLPIG